MKVDISCSYADGEEGGSQSTFSTPLDDHNLPPHLKKTIWTNANSILDDSNVILQAPGDSTAYIIKNLSGQKPDLVQPLILFCAHQD